MKTRGEKLWSGRFHTATDREVEEFSASIPFDKVLYRYDIAGSIAHARMLAKTAIISAEEAQLIIGALKEIEEEIEEGSFSFDPSLEDIHMHIEHRLIEKLGEVGKKLHTARSRNDQVVLDVRLYLRDVLQGLDHKITGLQRVLLDLAERYIDYILPGYTHLQRAQPIRLSHHLLAYFEMLERDRQRYLDLSRRVNVLPLGSAALAGSSLPIDRHYLAELLGFAEVSPNSIDAVSDRDFIVEFLAASAILMMHLSRLCEELILWSTAEFNFISIKEDLCTGSSLMPHKKNPDIPELIRGKTGRVYGNLMALLTTLKSLPLAYNRDLQEDKEPLFDTVKTVEGCLGILARLLEGVQPNQEVMTQASSDHLMLATDLVDYLVIKGVPFRRAHEIVGRIVRYCLEGDKTLMELSLREYKGFAPEFEPDLYERLSLERAVDNKISYGGTARENVMKRISSLKAEPRFRQ